jgi:hypothetical protein
MGTSTPWAGAAMASVGSGTTSTPWAGAAMASVGSGTTAAAVSRSRLRVWDSSPKKGMLGLVLFIKGKGVHGTGAGH